MFTTHEIFDLIISVFNKSPHPDIPCVVLSKENTVLDLVKGGFEAKYDDYLNLMKQKVGEMAENFQFDRPGF